MPLCNCLSAEDFLVTGLLTDTIESPLFYLHSREMGGTGLHRAQRDGEFNEWHNAEPIPPKELLIIDARKLHCNQKADPVAA